MNGTYEAAFDALREAGVEIVEVDFSPVQALSDQFMNGMYCCIPGHSCWGPSA